MTRTSLAFAPATAGVTRRCALGRGYAWRFRKSQVNAIHVLFQMADTAPARRLRRQPT